MRRVTWTEGAIADLEHIRRYVSAFQPEAALRLARRIADAVATLERHADVGADGIGELPVVVPYLIRYRVAGDAIVVIAIRHDDGARIV